MNMKIKSKHASILNALDEMQNSANYAIRKNILQSAERIIVEQERRIAELEAAQEKK